MILIIAMLSTIVNIISNIMYYFVEQTNFWISVGRVSGCVMFIQIVLISLLIIKDNMEKHR